mmetsp:Transcript_39204/g.59081  ORF Transcript_39204/g.59081 Transcript_39204/m.59081 type:complete len:204 (+) Transcript_39204:91-702(+)
MKSHLKQRARSKKQHESRFQLCVLLCCFITSPLLTLASPRRAPIVPSTRFFFRNNDQQQQQRQKQMLNIRGGGSDDSLYDASSSTASLTPSLRSLVEEAVRCNRKIVVVTGGVLSGIGKGVTASSIGVLFRSMGLRVTALKIDPYLNVDAGTMSPFEHGEVFVLDDGGETDLDLGNYERFLSVSLTKDSNLSTGKIYQVSFLK